MKTVSAVQLMFIVRAGDVVSAGLKGRGRISARDSWLTRRRVGRDVAVMVQLGRVDSPGRDTKERVPKDRSS